MADPTTSDNYRSKMIKKIWILKRKCRLCVAGLKWYLTDENELANTKLRKILDTSKTLFNLSQVFKRAH